MTLQQRRPTRARDPTKGINVMNNQRSTDGESPRHHGAQLRKTNPAATRLRRARIPVIAAVTATVILASGISMAMVPPAAAVPCPTFSISGGRTTPSTPINTSEWAGCVIDNGVFYMEGEPS